MKPVVLPRHQSLFWPFFSVIISFFFAGLLNVVTLLTRHYRADSIQPLSLRTGTRLQAALSSSCSDDLAARGSNPLKELVRSSDFLAFKEWLRSSTNPAPGSLFLLPFCRRPGFLIRMNCSSFCCSSLRTIFK